ncbi:hypothetical protein H1Q59_08185 [Holosporaceae bacterium 'Namur']|nr:hypothetical protein [Holosporaceae bacterium 'Namur']
MRDSISALKNLIIEVGFKFANIDPQSLNDALQDIMNNDVEAFEFKLNPRDTFMSREIIKYAYKYQGGVIVK